MAPGAGRRRRRRDVRRGSAAALRRSPVVPRAASSARVRRCPWRDDVAFVARFGARRDRFRREARKRIAATLKVRLRRAANFVGERRTRELLGRLGHLRIGMVEGVGSGAFAVVPTAVRQWRNSRRRLAAHRGPLCHRVTCDMLRGQYWVPPRCRSGRRSSADVRRCRAEPAPACGGCPRPQHRLPPGGVTRPRLVIVLRRLPANRRTNQAPAPSSASTAMNAKIECQCLHTCPRERRTRSEISFRSLNTRGRNCRPITLNNL